MEIIAHRGCASLAPENTLPAAKLALKYGADLWETDVSITKDDQLVLLHDDTLQRTTDACFRYPDLSPWRITEFTLEEIMVLDAGSWFITTDPSQQIAAGKVSREQLSCYQGIRIPTLAQALMFTMSLNWKINIELKVLPPEKSDFPLPAQLMAIIQETGITKENIRISSFDHELLLKIRDINSEIEIQALVGTENASEVDWQNPKFQTYNIDYKMVDRQFMESARSMGLRLNVYTVNDPSLSEFFKQTGAYGMFTDFPQLFEVIRE